MDRRAAEKNEDGSVRVGPWKGAPGEEPARGAPTRRKRFHERFLHMLGRDDPPEIVAASFAIGVAISFTPLIGLHWVIAILLSLLLRLKVIDVLLGTLVVNPLTLVPVSTVAIPLGRFLLQARKEAIAHLPWHQMLKRSFWSSAGPTMRAIGLQWGVGMFTMSFLAGALTYVVLVNVIRRRRANGVQLYSDI